MKPRPLPAAYAAMLAESTRVGWPLRFASDLTTHDRAATEAIDRATPLLWALYDGGTFLCKVTKQPIDRAGHFAWDAPAFVVRSCGDETRFYLWDGVTLRALASAEDARAACYETAHPAAVEVAS